MAALFALTACAPKRDFTAANVPAWDVVQGMALEPPEELSSGQQRDFEEGWRSLRRGRLQAAASDLQGLSRRYGRSAEIAAANGFLELRLGDIAVAEQYFQKALRERPAYGPAQSGYVLAALTAGDDESAYARVGALKRGFPQHPLVDRYETTLQINVAESRLARARELIQGGQFDAAANAYISALEVAPEVGALYLEASEAELAAGLTSRAAMHAQQATELEPTNATAFRILGEARYAGGELDGAYESFRTAAALSPRNTEIRARLDAIEMEYEAVNLPEEYMAIGDVERVNRAQLAALLFLELRDVFDEAPSGPQMFATDVADSWASTYIFEVLRVGIVESYPNHMYLPTGLIRRIELAEALSRALERLSPESYRAAKESVQLEQTFSDLETRDARYDAAALAVSLGLLTPREDGTFEPQGFVSGSEAVSSVESLAVHMTP